MKKKIKIGIVIGQMSNGGAEKQIRILSEKLADQSQYEPVVFCLSNYIQPNGSSLIKTGINFHYFNEENKKYLRKILWLIKKLKNEKCSIVYGILNTGNIYGGISAIIVGIPFISSIRNADPNLPPGIRILTHFFCQKANCVIANSDSCVISLRKNLKVTNSCVYIIPNAVQLEEINIKSRFEPRKEWGIPENAIVIGTIALLKKQKRPKFFIDVFSQFYSQFLFSRPVYFIWIGDGPEHNRVSQIIEKLPNDAKSHLLFVGARNDVVDCLKAFDLFILTSEYEGMPNALLEAMAVGLPCIATKVMGTIDVIKKTEKEIGILASSSDPQEFAKEIFGLMSDLDRMKQMGYESQEHIRENYSSEKMILAHCEVFDNVTKLNNYKEYS